MNQSLNGFEALEDRVLLAGNVTVAINAAGVLTISGDGAANGVDIVDTDGDGVYEIVGAGTTTIIDNGGILNGIGELTVAPTSIVINLGKGNDTLSVVDSGFAGGLASGINVSVNMGAGNDQVLVLGAGQIALGDVKIDLGAGNDQIGVFGNGADGFNSLSISAGAGNDQVGVDGVNANAIGVSGGAGNDILGVGFAGGFGTFSNSLSIDGGAGKDLVQLDGANALHGNIKLGGSADGASILNSTFTNSFTLNGNGGKDNVEIGGSNFLGINTLNGGGGKDVLVNLGGNTWSPSTTIKSFKLV